MRSISIAIAAGALTACATGSTISREQLLGAYQATAEEPVQSFFTTHIDGWTDLGDEHVAIWTSPNEAYLLDLAAPCPDLSGALGISMTSSGQRVYSGFDSVVVRQPAPLIQTGPCMIAEIRPVDTEALEAARAELQEADMVERETVSLGAE